MEDALRVASSPHDFKLLVAADGRTTTSMDDVGERQRSRDRDARQRPAASGARCRRARAPAATAARRRRRLPPRPPLRPASVREALR